MLVTSARFNTVVLIKESEFQTGLVTDRVKIVSAKEHLSEKTDNEELTLEMMNAGSDERLGCVARILGDVTVELPD